MGLIEKLQGSDKKIIYFMSGQDKKIQVSVGIPAYNEASNIKYLLEDILSQKQENYLLKEIIIVSDGSTDKTVELAQSAGSELIKVISHEYRVGKINRLNEMFEAFKGDALVQFDADIRLSNEYAIEEMIKPFLSDKNTAMVCGNHAPIKPKNFVEKAVVFGVCVWEDAVSMLGGRGERYKCTGQIRAFSKEFLQNFRLPPQIGSGEDTYSFYYARTRGFKIFFAGNAVVNYRVAATFADYIKQASRFIYAKKQMNQYFGEEVCKKYETMTLSLQLKALAKNIFKNSPLTVFGFLMLHLVLRISSLTYRHKKIWDIAESSKQLN